MTTETIPPAARQDLLVIARDDENFYTTITGDLASGGVFLATPAPLPIGTPVRLRIALPGGRVLRADGMVRWHRLSADDGPEVLALGCSIAWHSSDPRSLEAARAWLRRNDDRLPAALPLTATGS